MARVISIDGPVVSTGEIGRQLSLFRDVLGLRVVADEPLDAATVAALFGLDGLTARTVLLHTPGTARGVRLVAFDPPSATVIRPGGVGLSSDALKVVDVFASDLDAAVARASAAGFGLVGPPAELDLPTGERFREAHLRAPDGVLVAFIHPVEARAADYVSVTDRLFSEVQSCSGPVTALEPVRSFYEDGLGLPLGLEYRFESDSFGRMIGAGRASLIRACNFGRKAQDVMLGVIHYGLPSGFAPSLRDVCRAPNRGLVAVALTVEGLDALLERACVHGAAIAVPPASVSLAPGGPLRAATLRAPHGVHHLLLEELP
jgi:catechol 2,3-dioxygenase-like lactoylglutathione lyase family enzyme